MCYNDTKEVIRMEDICNVIPPKENPASLEFYYFVYETNFRKLPQPPLGHVVSPGFEGRNCGLHLLHTYIF